MPNLYAFCKTVFNFETRNTETKTADPDNG